MDPVSQGVVGAAVAQAFARPRQVAVAGLLGALAGMAPDLDVLIRSSVDPLLFLEFHRQFTHSLVFIPIGAALGAAVLFPLMRRRCLAREAYLYCLLGFATHGLLDACTSYGTQLYWPFSNDRVAWSNISIVDPLFTLPVLVLVLLAARRGRVALARAACVWVALYLVVGLVQRDRAEAAGLAIARLRDHAPVSVEAKPAFASLLLWKTIYEHADRYYVDAVRVGGATVHFPGQSAAKLVIARDLPWLDPGTQQARDLERFRWFSQDHLALDPRDPFEVIDIRYSMLPDRIDPLWGIRLEPAAPHDAFARFVTQRRLGRGDPERMVEMMFATDPPEGRPIHTGE
ncbi:MAG: metal-dependent hydrolase [Myxococcales bacterium]|nr:metal-dependent hydrolase [Myxococcales bacterium]